MQSGRMMLKELVMRQRQCFGHVMRKGELEYLVESGFVRGKRVRGRQSETYLTNLNKRRQSSPI